MNFATQYCELLTKYLPQPIQTEVESRRALKVVDRLMQKKRLTKAEEAFLELQADLIAKYESKKYSEPDISPKELLAFLIESREVMQADVAKATGISRSTISQVLSGERGLSITAAGKLARYFGLTVGAFLSSE